MDTLKTSPAPCITCERGYEYIPCLIAPDRETFKPTQCPACFQAMLDTRDAADGERRAWERTLDRKSWAEVCPLEYRETAQDKLPSQKTLQNSMEWLRLPPTSRGRGLGICGRTGFGKTRVMYLVLRAFYRDKARAESATHLEIAQWCEKSRFGFPDEKISFQVRLEDLVKADVTLLDDLGKGESGEFASAETCRIIHTRADNNAPLLWTANSGGEWLAGRLGADRGPATVRRLRECWIIDATTGLMQPPQIIL